MTLNARKPLTYGTAFVLGALVLSSTGRAQTAASQTDTPKPGMNQGMMADRQKMMAEMQASQKRLDDLIAAHEERRVAAHGVEDQALVGLRRLDTERRSVAEIHLHRLHGDAESRHLGGEAQRDALVGLDAQDEHAGLDLRLGERQVGHGAKLHGDLGHALG
jgi:hypothetical protein